MRDKKLWLLAGMMNAILAVSLWVFIFSAVADEDGFTTVCWNEKHGLTYHTMLCNKTNDNPSTVHESFDAWIEPNNGTAYNVKTYNLQIVERIESCTLHNDCFHYNTTDSCSVAWISNLGYNGTAVSLPYMILYCPDDGRSRFCVALGKNGAVENGKCFYDVFNDIPGSYYYNEWVKIPQNYTEYDNRYFSGNQLSYASGETKTFMLEWFSPFYAKDVGWGSEGYWSINPAGYWNTSYPYRYQCQSGTSTNGIVACNGTNGINGDIYFYENTTEAIYVYCVNQGCLGGNKAIGNSTSEVYWLNETSRGGNNPEKLLARLSIASMWNGRNESGVMYDVSGSNNNIALLGAPSNTAGIFGTAIDLEINDDGSSATYNSMVFTNGFSMNFWVYIESGSGYIMDVRDGSDHFYAYWTTGPSPVFFLGTDAGTVECTSATDLLVNQWHMITFVHNGTHANIYVNGTLDTACERSGTATSWDDPIDLNQRYNGITNGDQRFDEMVIYNLTLTPSQVSDIFLMKDGITGAEETPSSATDEFYNVTLSTPANNTLTKDNTPDFVFRYNGTFATASCRILNGTHCLGINASTLNSTSTTITSNTTLSDGSMNWWVNCTNSTYEQESDQNFTITFDTDAPGMTWLAPTPNNATVYWDGFYVNVSVDEACTGCIAAVNGTNYTMASPTTNTWIKLIPGLVHEKQYNFIVYCTDAAGNVNITGIRYAVINWKPSTGAAPSGGPSPGTTPEEIKINQTEGEPYRPTFEWRLEYVILILSVIILLGYVWTR